MDNNTETLIVEVDLLRGALKAIREKIADRKRKRGANGSLPMLAQYDLEAIDGLAKKALGQ